MSSDDHIAVRDWRCRPPLRLRVTSTNCGSHRHTETRLLTETALAICPTCRRPFTDEEQAK